MAQTGKGKAADVRYLELCLFLSQEESALLDDDDFLSWIEDEEMEKLAKQLYIDLMILEMDFEEDNDKI